MLLHIWHYPKQRLHRLGTIHVASETRGLGSGSEQ
jgi:hypothetical protein